MIWSLASPSMLSTPAETRLISVVSCSPYRMTAVCAAFDSGVACKVCQAAVNCDSRLGKAAWSVVVPSNCWIAASCTRLCAPLVPLRGDEAFHLLAQGFIDGGRIGADADAADLRLAQHQGSGG